LIAILNCVKLLMQRLKPISVL